MSVAVAANVTEAPHTPAVLVAEMFPGHTIVGASLSVTVTVKRHVAIRPEVFVAVAVTVVTPTGKNVPGFWEYVTVTPTQGSVAVATNVTNVPHWPWSAAAVMLPGHVIVGNRLLTTVTVNVHVAVFPAASVAVAVTTVVPAKNTLPEAWLYVTVVPGQLSVATAAAYVIVREQEPAIFPDTFAGQLMLGACVSFTVTVKEQVVVLPAASVAVAVTVVVPTLKAAPEAGL